jgi:Pre-rRNA-processing protein TSR2
MFNSISTRYCGACSLSFQATQAVTTHSLMSDLARRAEALIGRLRPGAAAVFSQWTALRMAVENGWGGPSSREKAGRLMDDVVDLFVNTSSRAVQRAKSGNPSSSGPGAVYSSSQSGGAGAGAGDDAAGIVEEAERELGEVYNDEIADMLFERLAEEFNTMPEDGSVEEVSLMLSMMWRELQDNNGASPLLEAALAAEAEAGAREEAERAERQRVKDERRLAQQQQQQQQEDDDDSDGWEVQR